MLLKPDVLGLERSCILEVCFAGLEVESTADITLLKISVDCCTVPVCLSADWVEQLLG